MQFPQVTPMGAYPGMQEQAQPPAPMGYAQFQPPLNLAPPPVVSQPAFQSPYQAQPGSPGQVQVAQSQVQVATQPMAQPQGQPMAAQGYSQVPGVPQAAPMMAPTSETPHQIAQPVPPGSLPAGRDRCFGKFNGADQWCVQCPEWIKSQCVPVSGQAMTQPQPAGGDQLAQLQAQLGGQQVR